MGGVQHPPGLRGLRLTPSQPTAETPQVGQPLLSVCLPPVLSLVIRVLPSEVPERHNLGPRVEQFLVSVLHFIFVSGSAFPATPSRSQDGAEESREAVRVCQETEMVSREGAS